MPSLIILSDPETPTMSMMSFRYHVMLNPPDMTVYYSLAAVVLLAPVAVTGSFAARERRRKAGKAPDQAGG